MLTLSNLSKRFGPKILFREVSLRMIRGEKMGLVGANGAGKTTLLSILLGELQEDEGMVEWERGTRIGYLPQKVLPLEMKPSWNLPQPYLMSSKFH